MELAVIILSVLLGLAVALAGLGWAVFKFLEGLTNIWG